METAVKNSDQRLVEILMKYKNSPSSPTLNQAMNAGDYEAVQILLEYGADPNSRCKNYTERLDNGSPTSVMTHRICGDGKSILEVAIERRELGLIDYILTKGADPTSTRSWIEEEMVIRNKQQQYIKKFDGTISAIYDVIMLNDFETLRLFGERGADLNKCCLNNLFTPLHVASIYQKRNCIEVLLSFGVDI